MVHGGRERCLGSNSVDAFCTTRDNKNAVYWRWTSLGACDAGSHRYATGAFLQTRQVTEHGIDLSQDSIICCRLGNHLCVSPDYDWRGGVEEYSVAEPVCFEKRMMSCKVKVRLEESRYRI